MKKIIILFLLFLLRMEGNAQSCINFEGNYNLNAWDLFWIDSKTIKSDSYHTNYLEIKDGQGGSVAANNTNEFSGNWVNKSCLCFDYKVDWNGDVNTLSVKAPKISIYQGLISSVSSGVSFTTNTIRAFFIGNVTNADLEDDKWQNFCLPVGLSSNGALPSNAFGTWIVIQGSTTLSGGTAAAAWDNLIQNVTGLLLYNDYNDQPSELVGFDNFCWGCPAPPCGCSKTPKPTLSWQAGLNIDSRAELALTCGETLTDKLDCFKPYLIGLKNPCGETCMPDEVLTKITYPNGSVVISNNLNGADLIANQVGTYTVSMKVKCNGKWCDECIVKFKQTKKCEPPCDNCKEKVGAKFNKNASSATVNTYPAATTINAVISLDGGADTYTEVRANIVDFNIFAENNACLKSYTSPNDWGSIVAGTLGGFNPIVTNYAGVSSTSFANNPREIVFGSQSPVAIASNAPLNLTIKIPGVNPLSCCCINSTIFIKITYRNNKCEECFKIIRIDANQCPDTDKGGTINFNPIAGSPQFRMQGINKSDAESLKSASKTGLKK
jgi:hypothetical protein